MLTLFSIAALTVVMRGHTGVRCGCEFLGRDGQIGWHLGFRNMFLVCFLLPSAWPLSRAYELSIILTGLLLVAISFAAVDPRRFRFQMARIERASRIH